MGHSVTNVSAHLFTFLATERFYEPPLLVETTDKHEENVSRGIAHSVKAMCEHFMVITVGRGVIAGWRKSAW